MNKFITLEDINGDISHIKPSTMDGFVTAEMDVPKELDENGQPKGDEKVTRFLAVIILRNGRQLVLKFDNDSDRKAKVEELMELA